MQHMFLFITNDLKIMGGNGITKYILLCGKKKYPKPLFNLTNYFLKFSMTSVIWGVCRWNLDAKDKS